MTPTLFRRARLPAALGIGIVLASFPASADSRGVDQGERCAVALEVTRIETSIVLGKPGTSTNGPRDAQLHVAATEGDSPMCTALEDASEIHMNAYADQADMPDIQAGDMLTGQVVRFDVSRGGTFNIRPEYWHVFLIDIGARTPVRFEGLGVIP